MSRSLKFVTFFSACVILSKYIRAEDIYGATQPAKHSATGGVSDEHITKEDSRDETVTKYSGDAPEKLSDEQFQEMHLYRDLDLATKDKFARPVDAQKTSQKSDLASDLGANFDTTLEDTLTKGKHFNPLATGD